MMQARQILETCTNMVVNSEAGHQMGGPVCLEQEDPTECAQPGAATPVDDQLGSALSRVESTLESENLALPDTHAQASAGSKACALQPTWESIIEDERGCYVRHLGSVWASPHEASDGVVLLSQTPLGQPEAPEYMLMPTVSKSRPPRHPMSLTPAKSPVWKKAKGSEAPAQAPSERSRPCQLPAGVVRVLAAIREHEGSGLTFAQTTNVASSSAGGGGVPTQNVKVESPSA